MNLKRFTPFVILLLTALVAVGQQAELEPSAGKLQQHVSYLASDALDGRRTGTAGANDAARYIAGEFSRLGLQAGNWSGNARRRRELMAQYLQKFPYVAGLELGTGNSFVVGNERLQPSIDWSPLVSSANAKAEGGFVFVGYGITAAELNYNDYAGLNTTGKIAIALQGTPDGDNPHGQFFKFEGVRWKTIAAQTAGAKALVVIARNEDLKTDRLSKLVYDNTSGIATIPVVVISRQGADKLFALSNTSVSQLEQ